MFFAVAAKAVLAVHLAFVLFVVLGGLLVLRWPRLAWLHLPAASWGVAIELLGGVCPLTPLENRLLRAAGREGYEGDFLSRLLSGWLYPGHLTRSDQWLLAGVALTVNLVVYGLVVWRRARVGGRYSM